MEIYRILADVVFWFHMVAALLVVVTGLLLPSQSQKKYHVFLFIILMATLLSWILLGSCPLTLLEDYLRSQHDPTGTTSGTSAVVRLFRVYFGLEIPPAVVTWTVILISWIIAYKLWSRKNQ